MADPNHNAFPPGSLERKDVDHVLHPTTNLKQHQALGPKIHSRAQGVYMWDSKGNQYLEGMSGLWCTALGYGEEELVETAANAMRELSYSQLFAGKSNEASILLAEKLAELTPIPGARVFFGASGSDANDTQIKLAWYYFNAIGKPEKKKILSRLKGYHGVTVASGSLTGLPAFHNAFDLPIDRISHLTAPYAYRNAEPGEDERAFSDRLVAELEDTIEREGADTIAAFIAEPVLGAGGVIPPPAGYFEGIQRVLAQHEILFIDDEVICGFGRTGAWFGADTYDLAPSTMSLAKALSSAYLPISAVVVPDWMHDAFASVSDELGNFGHGFTYTGHPVCAAVALKNLELMQQRQIVDHVASVAVEFQQRLLACGDHPLVGEARGVGLIGALELVADKRTREPFDPKLGVGATLQANCEAEGLLLRALGDTLAFCPPLIISPAQIDELFSKLDRALAATLATVSRAVS